MTLVNAVYIPTGIILSADSRTTGNGFVISDATNKVFLLFGRIGVVTAGSAHINSMPIEHYLKVFEMNNTEEGYTDLVYNITAKLGRYFKELSVQNNVYFMVAGYDNNEAFLYELNTIEGDEKINKLNSANEGELGYGLAWNGEVEVANRLTSGLYMPVFNFMNIQDAIDYSRHLIRTTIDQLRFEPRFATVGGEIDTLLIQPEGGIFINKKDLTFK